MDSDRLYPCLVFPIYHPGDSIETYTDPIANVNKFKKLHNHAEEQVLDNQRKINDINILDIDISSTSITEKINNNNRDYLFWKPNTNTGAFNLKTFGIYKKKLSTYNYNDLYDGNKVIADMFIDSYNLLIGFEGDKFKLDQLRLGIEKIILEEKDNTVLFRVIFQLQIEFITRLVSLLILYNKDKRFSEHEMYTAFDTDNYQYTYKSLTNFFNTYVEQISNEINKPSASTSNKKRNFFDIFKSLKDESKLKNEIVLLGIMIYSYHKKENILNFVFKKKKSEVIFNPSSIYVKKSVSSFREKYIKHYINSFKFLLQLEDLKYLKLENKIIKEVSKIYCNSKKIDEKYAKYIIFSRNELNNITKDPFKQMIFNKYGTICSYLHDLYIKEYIYIRIRREVHEILKRETTLWDYKLVNSLTEALIDYEFDPEAPLNLSSIVEYSPIIIENEEVYPIAIKEVLRLLFNLNLSLRINLENINQEQNNVMKKITDIPQTLESKRKFFENFFENSTKNVRVFSKVRIHSDFENIKRIASNIN